MTSTNEVAQFLDRYDAFASDRRQAAVNDFKQRFSRLRSSYEVTKAVTQERARYVAPGFNIFQLLGVQTKERETHSALLAELLDPSGSHGQQHLFLRHFLTYCHGKLGDSFAINDIENTGWEVHTEYHTPFGRFDILIRNPELGFQLVIENKIFAPEQPDALRRYSHWLAAEEEPYPQQVLLYLTPYGNESITHGGADYCRLSYRDDVQGWLEGTIEQVEAPRVKVILRQYLELLRDILKE